MVTALTPKVVRGAAAFIGETARELLAAVPIPGRADLVPAFTVPLPNRVTVHLLGFPASDAGRIAGWATELMESEFPATNRTPRGEGFAAAFPEFAGYIDEQIARRAGRRRGGEPPDDVLGRLLELEVEGVRLDPVQVRALVRNLITGGLTTTSQLLGNLVLQLLTVADLERALRANESMVARAVDESLRVTPPVLFVPRGCRQDLDVAGTPVHAGDRVVVGTASVVWIAATRTSTSPSGTGRTSVPAPPWPGRSPGSGPGRSCTGSRPGRCDSRRGTSRRTSPPSSSAARADSRSRPPSPEAGRRVAP